MLRIRFLILVILCLIGIASVVEADNLVVADKVMLPYLKPGTKIGDVAANPKDGARMVWVPAGEFLMGSNDSYQAYIAWRPQHKVYLDGYWMYKYEVTVAQYRKFCSETGKLMPHAPNWGWIDSHPMVSVTWQMANDYAKWAGATLPTEAQWEKAARGTDGRKFPWGNKWDASKCNSRFGKLERTRPVGMYPSGASPYGCMDMVGNVWEYCADWYAVDYYKFTPGKNPTGPVNGNARVLRGGSFTSSISERLRCAYRHCAVVADFDIQAGFRCSISP
jgi:formylglycine-generating enzyme required for sulfatase activity